MPIIDTRPEVEPPLGTAPADLRPRRERATLPPVRPLRGRWNRTGKRLLDCTLAALLAGPALMLVALAALAVRLTSRGPAFYSQVRLGRDGRRFHIYKIRTMIQNAESLTGPRWSLPGDPRVTPVGRVLRATHLDELPQLLNVLKGEMSLIGPRPERPEFFPELEAALPAYRQRINVLPGVTGLAQVQLPPDTDLGSVRQKLAFDLYYIRHMGFWLDVRLLFCTAFYAAGLPFAFLAKLLAIPTRRDVARATADLFPEPAPLLRRAA